VSGRAAAFRRHAHVHALPAAAAALLGWCVLSVAATGVAFFLPAADGYITLPFRNFVPAGAAVTVVGFTMLPPNHAYPLVTPRLAHARQLTLLAAVGITAAGIYLASWAGSQSALTATQCARSVLIWSCLAAASTTLWGRPQGWSLPLVSIAVILFAGRGPDRDPRWFNFSDPHAPDLGGWLAFLIALAIAVLAAWLTPWRRARLLRRAASTPATATPGIAEPPTLQRDPHHSGRLGEHQSG